MKNDAWFTRVAAPRDPNAVIKSQPVEKVGWTDEARAAAASARAQRVPGHQLSSDQLGKVQAAFVHRHGAIGEGKYYQHDEDWMHSHQFAFNKHGQVKGHAEPYYGDKTPAQVGQEHQGRLARIAAYEAQSRLSAQPDAKAVRDAHRDASGGRVVGGSLKA